MKIIVPMAGMGKRMRPHTLTVPKPLIPIAGKPIVQRLVEEIAKVSSSPIDEVAYIIGDFGKKVEDHLLSIAESLGAKGSIYYQKEALGTAHAVHCASPSLDGEVVVAFADTLFKADFKINTNTEAVIWVQKVKDPSAFGVVKVNESNIITDFVEKPREFVSDLAIIGIYYFKDGKQLNSELEYLIDNNIMAGGEYQLTAALENMKNKGVNFEPGEVIEWMDCGNKNATVHTNQRILEYYKNKDLVSKSATIENSIIIPPCFIDEDVTVKDAIVGPHVSIGKASKIENTIVSNSIIQKEATLKSITLKNSMIGNNAYIKDATTELNIGDYTQIGFDNK